MKFKYPFLLATLLMLALVVTGLVLGILSPVHALTLCLIGQGAILCLSRPQLALFITGISPAQLKEFEEICERLKEFGDNIPDVLALLKDFPELRRQVNGLRKNSVGGIGNSGVRWIGNVPFVTDDCASHLTAEFVMGCERLGHEVLGRLVPDSGARQRVLGLAKSTLGFGNSQVKTALDATTIPLPTIYVPQIIELVFAYGQARQFGTVFPLGAGTVKLPRLKAGEDDFAFLGVGTAGMSQAVPEKRVTAELITFTANKFGGLIRIPFEIEEDTFVPIGQFLARYIARQLAKGEDKSVFLGDGTATYANITGVGPYCVANPTYLRQLAAGKTKVSDATLNDFRAMRGMVNPATLANMAANGQSSAAYYLHPSLESLLVTFNTLNQPLIYIPARSGNPPTLDGFPIRWIGVSGANNNLAQPSTFIAFFGDLSYVYLGERGAVRVEVSKEVFFATDELAMRALERIDVEIMAIDAMTALQTAAA